MIVCQFTIVISAKKSRNIFVHRYICIFYVERHKIKFLLNSSFSDGNRKKSFFKAYIKIWYSTTFDISFMFLRRQNQKLQQIFEN